MLIGDVNDFQEMVSAFYGLTTPISSCDIVKVTEYNHSTKLQVCSLTVQVIGYLCSLRSSLMQHWSLSSAVACTQIHHLTLSPPIPLRLYILPY